MIPPPVEIRPSSSANPFGGRLGSGNGGVGAQLRVILKSEFGRNAAWFTLLSSFERLAAIVQTVLISRSLGIVEYGVYGLLFGTIGFVASVAGLQMGLTATVFISRYRAAEKARAAAVISIVERFGWVVGVAVVLLALPFQTSLSSWLTGTPEYQIAMVLGSVFVAASIMSGIQDGIAQGFEMFGVLAKLKLALALVVLAGIYPAATRFGLNGTLMAILAGVFLKLVVLRKVVAARRAHEGIPSSSGGVSFRSLVSSFAIPSMLVSLGLGFVAWFGMFWLSKQPGGFENVAIVNVGLQWRNPILLIGAAFGAVGIPAFSRMVGAGDTGGMQRLFRLISVLTLGLGAAAVAVLVLLSSEILDLYGPGFSSGVVPFALIVSSTLPAAMAGVYLQRLVGSGQMWRQFWLHVPSVAVIALGYALLIPRYSDLGYAASTLAGSAVLLGTLALADYGSGFHGVNPVPGVTPETVTATRRPADLASP